ncbi:hypothetical protein [Nocardia nepalensis]|uniref:hypothetical protein n=1 Tax=Nocardia nepalensis TaxID=3375448 RepID=UPI003B67C81B
MDLDQEPEVGVLRAISVLMDALGSHPELLRVVVEQMPQLSGNDVVFTFERQVGDIAWAALMLWKDSLPGDLDFGRGVVDAGPDG